MALKTFPGYVKAKYKMVIFAPGLNIVNKSCRS